MIDGKGPGVIPVRRDPPPLSLSLSLSSLYRGRTVSPRSHLSLAPRSLTQTVLRSGVRGNTTDLRAGRR